MASWQFETIQEQLARLRAALEQAQAELIEAEAQLADERAEVNAFEFEFEAQVGHWLNELEALEAEIKRYNDRIQMARNKRIFGIGYLSADEQYRRAWQAPPASAPTPPPQPLGMADETRVKQLYRQLARRFHPDLAMDDADRARRTEKMAAINDAYAARSLVELEALAKEPDNLIRIGQARPGQTQAQLVQALEVELARCQRRLREVESERGSLHRRPSVQLSIEVKLAHRRGRDLLGEMAAELEHKIARKTVERDLLKAQFDQLGPEQGIIPIKR
jgi:septal ring factor EnvC (AmiA/AmiB activator)